MNAPTSPEKVIVRPDSYLTLHYRIEILTGPAAGSVFTDTFTERPATLQLGVGQWSPGMEQPLLGRTEQEQFEFVLPCEQAYGARNPDLLQRVTRKALATHAPEGEQFEAGEMIEFHTPDGGRYSGVLKELDEQSALLDFNHPLAGADLKVEVYILGIL